MKTPEQIAHRKAYLKSYYKTDEAIRKRKLKAEMPDAKAKAKKYYSTPESRAKQKVMRKIAHFIHSDINKKIIQEIDASKMGMSINKIIKLLQIDK